MAGRASLTFSKKLQASGLHRVSADSETGSGHEKKIDIIAIHGLDTNSPRTWVAYEREGDHGGEGRQVNWLCDVDMLPHRVPEADIFTFDYNAKYHDEAPVQTLLGHAQNLLALITEERKERGTENRPLIFVASCFGGLVLAEALTQADSSASPYNAVLRMTVGVVFLGTPLRGSKAATAAKWRTYVAGILGKETSDSLIRDLDGKSGVLQDLVQKFAVLANSHRLRLPAHCFYECRTTEIWRSVLPRTTADRFSSGFTNNILVEQSSACLDGFPRTGLDVRHALVNKFRSPEDVNFKLVAKCIRDFAEGAQELLSQRLEQANITKVSLWNDLGYSISRPSGGSPTASAPSKNAHWTIMRHRNTHFTGRKKEVKKVIDALQKGFAAEADSRKCFVITGMGGQGKSEICLKVAEDIRRSFWGVFWVDVSAPSLAQSGFALIAKRLGYSIEEIDEVKLILANIKESWLLILDNADDPNFDYSTYFPSGDRGSIIISSRNAQCTSSYSTIGFIHVDELSMEDSTTLLFKAANAHLDKWSSNAPAAQSIASLLNFHALALIQAGAYIAKRGWKFEQYPTEYDRQRKRLLEYWQPQAQSRYRSVYATFEASASAMMASKDITSMDALQLLRILAMLHYSVFPQVAFEYAWAKFRTIVADKTYSEAVDGTSEWHINQLPEFLRECFEGEVEQWNDCRYAEAVSLLASFSLISRSDSGIFMHPLVHAWAKDRLTPKEQIQSWTMTGSVMILLDALMPLSAYGPVLNTYRRQLLPQVQCFLANRGVLERTDSGADIEEHRKHIIPILFQSARFLRHMGEPYDVSEPTKIVEEIFALVKADRYEPSRALMPVHDFFASILYDSDRQRECISLLERCKPYRSIATPKEITEQLRAVRLLAAAHLGVGRTERCIRLLENALKNQNDRAEYAKEINDIQASLSYAYSNMQQYKKALLLHETVVTNAARIFGERSKFYLGRRRLLGALYCCDGQFERSISVLEATANEQATILGDDHEDYLRTLMELGRTYRLSKQTNKAMDVQERVVQQWKIKVGETNRSRLDAEEELAFVYFQSGDLERGSQLVEHVLEKRPVFNPEDPEPENLRSAWNLSSIYNKCGRYDDAFSVSQPTVQLLRASLSEGDPHLLGAEYELAYCLYRSGRYDESLPIWEHIVEMRRKNCPTSELIRLNCENNLGSCYYFAGRYNKALPLWEHVVGEVQNTLPETDSLRLAAEHNLGLCLHNMDKFTEALPLWQQVVKVKRETLPEHDKTRLESEETLSNCLYKTGRLKEAHRLFSHVLKYREENKATSPEDYKDTLELIAEVESAMEAEKVKT